MTDTLPEFLLHWAERAPDAVLSPSPTAAEWLRMYRDYDLDRAGPAPIEGLVTGQWPAGHGARDDHRVPVCWIGAARTSGP